jgi:hypothetical protein
VLAEADEYMETHGERAYERCRTDCRDAEAAGDRKRARFLGSVRNVLAKKFERDRRLDTATRYQAPYDPGPGYVRSKDVTLH